jgi:hypothetical protein
MKTGLCHLAFAAFALIACAGAPVTSPAQAVTGAAQSNARWVGVWEGRTKDLPGLTVTLGDDPGDVNGTIVLNVMRDGEIVGHVAHVLLHPHVAGNTLSFQIRREESAPGLLDMSIELSGENAAQIQCPKCGAAPFSMAMERIQ